MTLSQLNNSLAKDFKSYIKTRGYVSSGKLMNSIEFKCSYNKEKIDLDIELIAMDYLKYLDDGQLLQDFLSTSDAIGSISEFLADEIAQESANDLSTE